MSTLLEVESLNKRFDLPGGRTLHAVNDVSLAIEEGESLGLVGESGSGKTTTGRCILRLLEPSSGSIRFRGEEVLGQSTRKLRELRAQMRIVFQEPFESLNPRRRVADIISEPLLLHRPDLDREQRRLRVLDLMDRVRLGRELAMRRPRELSGGQQQRVGIARAIATSPQFIVLDEPTSALDVSVRAQILDLLLELQREQGLSYLFISHDLSTIQYSCTRIAVMYLGRIVEYGRSEQIFGDPRHPYTKALLSAILAPDPDQVRAPIVLSGEAPSAIELPSGCGFAPRCPIAIAECSASVPPLREVRGREVACIRAEDVPALMDPAVRDRGALEAAVTEPAAAPRTVSE
jgi:oligopeptide/dipeptide ABC transporter ATP-binding protein